MIALRLSDVSAEVTPGGPSILDHVDLTLARGTFTALRGRSGSGKTTLLNVILGWITPTSGHIELGEERVPLQETLWRSVTLVPQTAALFPELTVKENLEAATHFGHLEPRWPIDDLMDRLDLAHLAHRPIGQISLGEQQRCSIARAVAPEPDLLLADEPLASQDEAHALVVLATLTELCRRGTACLVASHDPLVLLHAQTTIHLGDGKLMPPPSPVGM